MPGFAPLQVQIKVVVGRFGYGMDHGHSGHWAERRSGRGRVADACRVRLLGAVRAQPTNFQYRRAALSHYWEKGSDIALDGNLTKSPSHRSSQRLRLGSVRPLHSSRLAYRSDQCFKHFCHDALQRQLHGRDDHHG
jgi:hypothetical protein